MEFPQKFLNCREKCGAPHISPMKSRKENNPRKFDEFNKLLKKKIACGKFRNSFGPKNRKFPENIAKVLRPTAIIRKYFRYQFNHELNNQIMIEFCSKFNLLVLK